MISYTILQKIASIYIRGIKYYLYSFFTLFILTYVFLWCNIILVFKYFSNQIILQNLSKKSQI